MGQGENLKGGEGRVLRQGEGEGKVRAGRGCPGVMSGAMGQGIGAQV